MNILSAGRSIGKTDKMADTLIPVLKVNHSITIFGSRAFVDRVCQQLERKGFPCILRVQKPLEAMEGKETVFGVSLMHLGHIVMVNTDSPLAYGSLIINKHSQQLAFISKAVDRRVIEGGERFNHEAWQHVVPYLVYMTPGDELDSNDLLAYPEEVMKVGPRITWEHRDYPKVVMDLRVNHSHVHSVMPGNEPAEKKIIKAYVEKRALSVK